MPLYRFGPPKSTQAVNMDGGYPPEVIAFVRFRPDLLSAFSRDDNAFPSPRSWEFDEELVPEELTQVRIVSYFIKTAQR